MEFKKFVNESVADYIPQVFDYLKDAPDDTVVHFSRVPKIGFNPKPHHQDPVGLYTFPKKYVLSPEFGKNNHFFSMPFVSFLRPKQGIKILNLSKLTEKQVDDFLRIMGVTKDKVGSKPGEWLWHSMEQELSKYPNKNIGWNKLFKKLNIDALQDDGDSIIHMNEPSQLVFLTPNSWEVTNVVHNLSTKRIYGRIALEALKIIADEIFGKGDYRINKKSKSLSSGTGYTASGNIDGIQHSIYLTYEDYTSAWYNKGDTGGIHHEFSGHVNIYSPKLKESLGAYGERFVVSWGKESKDIKETAKPIIERIKNHINNPDNYYGKKEEEDKSKELLIKIKNLFGFGGELKTKDSYSKVYEDGRRINISAYIIDDDYYLNVSLEVVSLRNKRSIYSQGPKFPKSQADRNIKYTAEFMAMEALDKLQDAVMTHYNPDSDKHGNSWLKYEYADTGMKFLRWINQLRNKVGKKVVIG